MAVDGPFGTATEVSDLFNFLASMFFFLFVFFSKSEFKSFTEVFTKNLIYLRRRLGNYTMCVFFKLGSKYKII